MNSKKRQVYPKNLGPDARKFWKWATSYFDVPEEKLTTLEGTARNWQIFVNCEREISFEGLVNKGERGWKMKPEVSMLKIAWTNFCLGARLLGFFDEDQQEKKPSGGQIDDRWKKPRGNGVVTWGK